MTTRMAEQRDGSLLRDGTWLSKNARQMHQELIGVDWSKYLTLADKIDDGRASENADEIDTFYEAFPLLVDHVIDLFNMVSRRDEELAALKDEMEAAALDAKFNDTYDV